MHKRVDHSYVLSTEDTRFLKERNDNEMIMQTNVMTF